MNILTFLVSGLLSFHRILNWYFIKEALERPIESR